jgi:transcriptional regulator with XRE-family HTH domain
MPNINNSHMGNNATEFGRLCRVYRASLGLNMIQAAEKIGTKQTIITKIELGKLSASFEFIKKSIDTYQIRDWEKKVEFLLSYLKSAKKFEIQLDQLGPSRKEWLSALCILGEVDKKNPEGWNDLLQWLDEFREKLCKPEYVTVDNNGPNPL